MDYLCSTQALPLATAESLVVALVNFVVAGLAVGFVLGGIRFVLSSSFERG
jgi:hypothetical protein